MNDLKKTFDEAAFPIEKALFRAKLGLLEKKGDIGDETFARAVTRAKDDFGVEETKFRDAFGLSAGAVDRWSHGKNLPHKMVRPKILGWIKQQI